MRPNRDAFGAAIGRCAATLLFVAMTANASGPDAERAFAEAIHREVVLGDLQGAMALYGGIVADTKANRETAAGALLRIGECLEKLGQSEEAYGKYQRLVREYAD